MGRRSRLAVGRAVMVVALSALGSGCATQEWTRDLFAKRQAEVEERFVRVDTRARAQGERIDRVEDRLTRVGDGLVRVNERLAQMETAAREQDDQLDQVEIRVARLDAGLSETRNLVRGALAQAPSVGIRSAAAEPRVARTTPERPARRTLVSIVHVLFSFDGDDLDARAEAALAAIVKELRDNPSLTIDLEGSTDPVGALDYNVRLSQRRVDAVRRWLVGKGVSRARIVGSAGRGPLVDASLEDDAKRRVMVKLMTAE
jgi:outer membrane protein OmpA-like peptidoglycan-associated protein